MPKGIPNKRYTPAFKKMVIETMQKEKLRQSHAPDILLSIALLLRATFFYHLKRIEQADKYEVAKKVAPNSLNRDFQAEKPNQKWVADVTEFSLYGQKPYLSPILDLHKRTVVSARI